jgi:hypothetical protein
MDPASIAAVGAGLGGPILVGEIVMGPGDDPNPHVIAGGIMSPGQKAPVTVLILSWMKEHRL